MRALCVLLCTLSAAHAQLSAPGVQIGIQASAPIHYELARQVLVQPARLDTSLSPGHSTGTLTFTLMSPTNALVTVEASDPRLVPRGGTGTALALMAYTEQSVTLVALAPHSGTLRVRNADGQVIAQVPYTVAPARVVNQSAGLSYLPAYNRLGASYSVSGVTQSPLDPSWNVNVTLGVDTRQGNLTGGVSVGVSW